MSALTETLGKRLTAQEVAEYLGVDAETVRRYYNSLGGIRLGRLFLFFENLIIQAIKENSHALQEEEKNKVEWIADVMRRARDFTRYSRPKPRR